MEPEVNRPQPLSPFSPAMEGFQTILLAGAASKEASLGILEAFDDATSASSDTLDQITCYGCHARWANFEVAELQQLLVAIKYAERKNVIADGPSNLLLGLQEEIGRALDNRLEDE